MKFLAENMRIREFVKTNVFMSFFMQSNIKSTPNYGVVYESD